MGTMFAICADFRLKWLFWFIFQFRVRVLPVIWTLKFHHVHHHWIWVSPALGKSANKRFTAEKIGAWRCCAQSIYIVEVTFDRFGLRYFTLVRSLYSDNVWATQDLSLNERCQSTSIQAFVNAASSKIVLIDELVMWLFNCSCNKSNFKTMKTKESWRDP